MTPKLTAMALSTLSMFIILTPFKSGLAGNQGLVASNSVGKNGIINRASSWQLRKGSGWIPANLTQDESVVLMTLCRLAIGANGGIWRSERINAAIAVLAFGGDSPDNLQATVYKTCMMAGDMGSSRR